MRFKTILEYLLSRYKEEMGVKLEFDYLNNNLYYLLSVTYKGTFNKDLKDVKRWAEIQENLFEPPQKPKTAKEIEKEVTEKFRNWG